MDKEIVKKEVQKLIDKYERVVSSGQLKKYNEEETKKDFILPLFEILGWDVFDKKEVSAEEHQLSGGRVDYGFYLDGRIKFYLEAKPLKADIDREDYANQAVRYSWNKGATWAVLTNFETIKVFNAQDISQHLSSKLYFSISHNEYLERFDQLWSLSKVAFQENLIDKEAERVGKKLQKVSVGDLLYKDLQKCREILTDNLPVWNEELKKDRDLLDEGVQKIIDRLIFIRVAEDREVELETLLPLIRQWEASKGKTPLYASMVSKFRELDDVYDSNLFSPHPFEKWEDYGDATKKVIDILYGKKGYYEYYFKIMPAYVLGSFNENYLGYRLSLSRKGLTLDKDATKRKEQGIYYTPVFIVDYIVRNALKPILDNCRSINDLKKIKVLDPACGSGSFLIKALEVINEKYKEFGDRGREETKLSILLENIYGVDLDEQAVEIARLNLLINALDKRMKLPPLKNIRNGNSLISGTDEELKRYFGKNFRDKKPFNWQEEFPEVFKQGGFDVIIGNPPWSSKINSDENKILAKKIGWSEKNVNICALFINDGLEKLKPNGILAFLLPKVVIKNASYFEIRKKILNNFHIRDISDFGQFPGVASDAVGLIIEKTKNDIETSIHFFAGNELISRNVINQKAYKESSTHIFSLELNPVIQNLLNKIKHNSEELGDIFKVRRGIELGQKSLLTKCTNCGIYNEAEVKYYAESKDKKCKKCGHKLDLKKENLLQISSDKKDGKYVRETISGNQLKRYLINGKYFIPQSLVGIDYKEEAFSGNKILLKRIDIRIEGTFTDRNLLAFNTVYSIFNSEITKDKFLATLGILNSKLMGFFYEHSYNIGMNLTTQVTIEFLLTIPIKINLSNAQKNLINLVKKILDLHKGLEDTQENSNGWERLKSEIEKTNEKIDEEVYKLYGLTLEEIKIVEDTS